MRCSASALGKLGFPVIRQGKIGLALVLLFGTGCSSGMPPAGTRTSAPTAVSGKMASHSPGPTGPTGSTASHSATPGASQTRAASSRGSDAPRSANAPAPSSSAPNPTATLPPATEGMPFFVLDTVQTGNSVLSGIRVRAGVSGTGITADLRFSFADVDVDARARVQPFGAGPVDGKVVFAFFDGKHSELHLLSVRNGVDMAVLRTPAIIETAALDAAADRVYYVPIDPRTGREDGIWAVGARGEGRPRQLAPPDPEWVANPMEDFGFMHLTPDGSRLIAVRCASDQCSYRIVSTVDGRVVRVPSLLPQGDFAGITNELAAFAITCDLPCGDIVVDMVRGDVRRVGQSDGPVVLTEGSSERPVLVASHYLNFEEEILDVIDAVTGSQRELWRGDKGVNLVLNSDVESMELPDGFVLVAEERDIMVGLPEVPGAAFLIDVKSGAAAPLEGQ